VCKKYFISSSKSSGDLGLEKFNKNILQVHPEVHLLNKNDSIIGLFDEEIILSSPNVTNIE